MKFLLVALMVIIALASQAMAASISEATGGCKAENNEIWVDCGSGCGEITCADKLARRPTDNMMCPAVCRTGCYCKHGFIRLGKNTRGIDERHCMPDHMCH